MMMKIWVAACLVCVCGASLSGVADISPVDVSSSFRVAPLNGAPGLYRGTKPVAPLFFWQWDAQEEDVRAMSGAGIDLFSVFGSFGHYEHPYWTPQGLGDMAYQEKGLDDLCAWAPQCAILPRLFSAAPQWWIDAHPGEQIRYTNPNVAKPHWQSLSGSVPRESFASETLKRELGPVYRAAVEHLYKRYGDRLLGIHVTNGPWGEHFAWDALTQSGGWPLEVAGFSDASKPMTARFRAYLRETYQNDVARLRSAWCDPAVTFETATVPTMEARLMLDEDGVWRDPAKGGRVMDYFTCMNIVSADLVDYYAGLVKEASQGRLATLAFYGYTQDEHWAIECDHRAISRAYRSPNLDMVSAPHTYHRRSPGEDGLMRCYMDSAALHGKLFIDEGDDMSHLEQAKPYPDGRCSATNLFESVNLFYREFGNAATHGTGLWYMDLKKNTFRAPELVEAVGRMRRAAELTLTHDRAHRSQVAIVSNPASEFYMGYRRTEANNICQLMYHQQMGAFCRAGAPFDWYLIEDLDAVSARNYKVVVFLDCQYLTDGQKAQVDALKRDGRHLVFFHAPGYVSPTGLSRSRMEEVCGVKMAPGTRRGVLSAVDVQKGREWGCGITRPVDGPGPRARGVRYRTPGTAQKGLFLPATGDGVETLMTGVGDLAQVPVAVKVKHGPAWTAVFSALPALAPDVLRRLYHAAGVHVYTDEDVVLSANASWLMLHTRRAGRYPVRLPNRAARVVDVTTDQTVATNTDTFTLDLRQYQTSLLLIEK